MLREQYFIDILIKILEETFTRAELEAYNTFEKGLRTQEEQRLLEARQGVYQP